MFKCILVPATGAETDAPVFATALAVASLAGAHLTFLHVRPDMQQTLMSIANSSDLGGGFDYLGTVEGLERQVAEQSSKAEHAVQAFCALQHLTVLGQPRLDRPSAEWKLETGNEARYLAEYGRAADLMVIGRQRDGETAAMDLLEASLLATGRPVLIASDTAPLRLPGTVAIAWKNTAEAARAIAAAQPFIDAADQVIIFTVEENIEIGEQSSGRLRDSLSWHNVNTTLQRLERGSDAPVETLLAAVGAAKADLLVMGGYGHSRIREVIFGGFTRRILSGADLPVLMAH